MQAQNIKVIIGGNKIEVSSKFAHVSNYMTGLLSLGFEDDEEIEIDRVSQQTFKEVIQFYTLNNYEDVTIKHPINGTDLANFVTVKNVDFINRHAIDSPELMSLIKAAQFLGCQSLLKVCAARFSCYLYFQDTKQAFEAKLKQLNINKQIEFEDNEKFKRLYPFMNKQANV